MQIADDGRRVVVGAYGTESFEGSELAGKYAQLLTVEFGTFESPELEGRTTLYSDTFGASERGVESSRPPRCNQASFAMQYLPGRGGVMQLTRSRR